MIGTNERRHDTDLFISTRKLIRPHLTPAERRRNPSHPVDPLSHAIVSDTSVRDASTHAEAFYFQKQIQQKTEMTLVLDDGEELRGVLEWYDSSALKVRSGRRRVLVYKTAIKYMFKTGDGHVPGSVMK